MVGSFQRLAKIYGPFFKLNLLNREAIVLSSHELIAEVVLTKSSRSMSKDRKRECKHA